MLINRMFLFPALVMAEADSGDDVSHANCISQVQIRVLANPSMDKNLKFL